MSNAERKLPDLARYQKLGIMHETLTGKRRHLCSARPPHEDVIAEAERQVDAIVAGWSASQGPAIVAAVAGAVDVDPHHQVRGLRAGNLLDGLVLDTQAVIALLPEEVKRGLRAAIRATEYVEGPPMRERLRLIADVDAELAAVEAEHAKIVDQAADVGITLDLLPEEAARRLAKQRHDEFVATHNRMNADAIRRGVAKAMQ